MLFRTRKSTLGGKMPHRRDFAYQYKGQIVPYSVWCTDPHAPITTIVFLGTVQVGKLPIWIAKSCPPGTAVVQGAPHWLASDDGSDTPAFMHRFTKEAFERIAAAYRIGNLRIIVESQAVPGVLKLLIQPPSSTKVNKVALLQPLGLNTTAFAGTAQERITVFKTRINHNLRHQLTALMHDRRLVYNHAQLLKTVGYNNTKSDAQYGSGLAYDALGDLKKLYATDKQLVIVCGGNDMLFPPQEIQAAITQNNLDIPLVVVPNIPHSPLATKQGLQLLTRAFEYFGDPGNERI